LVTDTVCVAELFPTIVPGKLSDEGLAFRIGPGATPVPDKGTVLVIPAMVRVRFPLRAPAAVGLNVTLTVQDDPAATLLPQLLVWPKSPEVVIDVTGAAAVPVLVTVTAWAALVEPVACEPNPSEVGLTEMMEPLSGRYGGNAGAVMFWHCVAPKMPELPPPSVSVKPTPQL